MRTSGLALVSLSACMYFIITTLHGPNSNEKWHILSEHHTPPIVIIMAIKLPFQLISVYHNSQ